MRPASTGKSLKSHHDQLSSTAHLMVGSACFHIVQTLIDCWFDPIAIIGGAHRFSDLEHGGSAQSGCKFGDDTNFPRGGEVTQSEFFAGIL